MTENKDQKKKKQLKKIQLTKNSYKETETLFIFSIIFRKKKDKKKTDKNSYK